MAIESIAEQGAAREDTVEAFWVVREQHDDRGITHLTVLGFFVPFFNNLFFTPDCGAVVHGYREHEKGDCIRLYKKIEIPAEIVFKVINVQRFLDNIKEWASKVSY